MDRVRLAIVDWSVDNMSPLRRRSSPRVAFGPLT